MPVIIKTDKCTGCETCLDRCQMEAITIENDTTAINLERCIGCGLCVPTCPEDAIHLVKKDQEIVPPLTEEELFDTILAQKSTLAGRMRNYSLKTLLRVASRFSN